METAAFKQRLQREGFIEGGIKALEAGMVTDVHEHPCDVCGLVLDGEIALTIDGAETAYRTGDVFTLAAGCLHAEKIGQAGVRYLIGRRHACPES